MTELLREWFAGKIIVSDAVPPDEVWLFPSEQARLQGAGRVRAINVSSAPPVLVAFPDTPHARVGHSCTACGEVAARHCHACSTCEAAVGPCVAKP